MKQFARLGVLATCTALSLSACTVLEGDKVDYKSASRGAALDVPPDLNQLSRDSRYTVPGGTVIVGRFLGGETLERLVGRTLVDIALWTIGDPAMPAQEREVFGELRGSFGPLVRIGEGQPIHVYATLQDVRKVPVVLARVDVEREISARGATATRWALVSTFAAGASRKAIAFISRTSRSISPMSTALSRSHARRTPASRFTCSVTARAVS